VRDSGILCYKTGHESRTCEIRVFCVTKLVPTGTVFAPVGLVIAEQPQSSFFFWLGRSMKTRDLLQIR
jgi:hypothetical protein